MCFLPKATSVSSRRRHPLLKLRSPTAPLAVLDLAQPGEREAQELVRRLSTGRGASWHVLGMGRDASALLCVVRWRRPQDAAAPYSLAEVSLTEPALCWRSYPSAEAARQEMDRRCAPVNRAGGAP